MSGRVRRVSSAAVAVAFCAVTVAATSGTAAAGASSYTVADEHLTGEIVAVNGAGDLLLERNTGSRHAAFRLPKRGGVIALVSGDSVSTDATDMNRAGESVGVTTAPDGTLTAQVWDNLGNPTPLAQLFGTDPAGPIAMPSAISDKTTIVGSLYDASRGHDVAVLWSRPDYLVTINGSRANAVNDKPLAGGEAYGHAAEMGVTNYRLDLGQLPGEQSSEVTDLNDRGVAVGYSQLDGRDVPVEWDKAGHVSRLSLGTAVAGTANAVNVAGLVVGTVTTSGGDTLAVVWPDGRHLVVLPTLAGGGTPGSATSAALDVNNHGVIGGYAVEYVAGHRQAEAVTWLPG